MMPGDARECRVMSGDVIVIGIGIGANDKWVGGGPFLPKIMGQVQIGTKMSSEMKLCTSGNWTVVFHF